MAAPSILRTLAWPAFAVGIVGWLAATSRPAAAAGPDGTWAPDSLPALSGPVAVYDPSADRLVIATGSRGASMNRQVLMLPAAGPHALIPTATTGDGPRARTGAAAICDPLGGRVVLFGGVDSLGLALGDAWALSLSDPPTWTALTPAGPSPAARSGHCAVYDPVRRRMVVYGGSSPVDGPLTDVWTLALDGPPTWALVDPTGAIPASRSGQGAIWDSGRDRMLVFGGQSPAAAPCYYSSELWELGFTPGPHWDLLAAGGAATPAGRVGFNAVHDAVHDRMVVFGGLAGCGPAGSASVANDVWTLALASLTWERVSPLGASPSARSGAAGDYDASRNRLVIDGGNGESDAWELVLSDPPAWHLLAALPSGPGARAWPLTLLDPKRDRVIVYGGTGPSGSPVLGDLWMSPLSGTPHWTRFDLPNAPPLRAVDQGFYDPVRDRVVMLTGEAGVDPGVVPHEVWALSLVASPAWTQLATSGTVPPPRTDQVVVYDPVADRMLMFGGSGADSYTDTYALSLAGPAVWTRLATTGVPPELTLPSAATYDPLRHRMLVFGGDGGDHTVHALGLDEPMMWTTLAPSGTPPQGRYGHSMIYDPGADRVVIFGGTVGAANPVDETWELSLGDTLAWRLMAPGGETPTPRRFHAAFYDPRRDRMVTIAGQGAWPADELRFLDWGRGLLGVWLASSVVTPDEVHLVWYCQGAGSQALTCIRSVVGGAWEVLGDVVPDANGRVDFVDHAVVSGEAYRYALRSGELSGPAVTVHVPTAPGLSVRPAINPASADVSLWLSLPSSGPVEVVFVDVAGRIARRERLATLAAGRQLVHFPAPSAQGLYWVQLRQGTGVANSHVVVLK